MSCRWKRQQNLKYNLSFSHLCLPLQVICMCPYFSLSISFLPASHSNPSIARIFIQSGIKTLHSLSSFPFSFLLSLFQPLNSLLFIFAVSFARTFLAWRNLLKFQEWFEGETEKTVDQHLRHHLVLHSWCWLSLCLCSFVPLLHHNLSLFFEFLGVFDSQDSNEFRKKIPILLSEQSH